MATTLTLKHITLFSLLVLLLSVHFKGSLSVEDTEEDDDDDVQEYILDSVLSNTTNGLRRSRFLASTVKKNVIKKGTRCDAKTNPYVCNGVSANKGTSLLYCCKKHCRNVLGDRNNCGHCGHKCGFGERCCGGVCTNVLSNAANCGRCNKNCGPGVKCEYGYCGYA